MGLGIYTIHEKEGPKATATDVILVREGFSVWAFLFPPLWALYHGMWPVAFVLLATCGGLAFLPEMIAGGEAWVDLGVMAMMLLVGFLGSDLRQWTLKLRGYNPTGVVGGENLADAERQFFSVMGTGFY